MTSKTAFRNTLQRKNTREKVFVPFLYGLAAKITQLPWKEMAYDPTYFAHSLEASHKLFGVDAIVTCFDSSIEAESCGCTVVWNGDFGAPNLVGEIKEIGHLTPEEFLLSGRIPVLLEATKRLVISLGRETAVAAAISGPCSLVHTLKLHSALFESSQMSAYISRVGSLITRLVKSLSELKVDAVFFREDVLGEGILEALGLYRDAYLSIYRTLFNIVKFYDAHPVLVVRGVSLEALKELCEAVRPNGVVLLGARAVEDHLKSLKGLSESLRVSFGLPLPVGLEDQEALRERFERLESFFGQYGPHGFFYTTDGDVSSDLPLEMLHELMRMHGERNLRSRLSG